MRVPFRVASALLLTVAVACGSGEEEVAEECGACTPPPACEPDGAAPDPYPECSCSCMAGETYPPDTAFCETVPGADGNGCMCNDNRCLVPRSDDGGTPDSGAGDAGASEECGGCTAPPACEPDGAAPAPYPECSCGCIAGETYPPDTTFCEAVPGADGNGCMCNDNDCLVPRSDDGGTPDSGAGDSGAPDAGA